jgi:peptide/nickel transport system substrate-binding protein
MGTLAPSRLLVSPRVEGNAKGSGNRNVFAACLVLAACGGASEADWVRRGIAADPVSLPAVGSTSAAPGDAAALVSAYVYEAVLGVDLRTGRLIPVLARAVDPTADGRGVRVLLRSGIPFHDGTLLGAADVAASIEAAARAPAALVPEPTRAALRDLMELRAPTPDVVELSFRRPSFRNVAVLAELPIVPARVAEVALSGRFAGVSFAGTGPYFIWSWRARSSLVLRRHERYHGPRPAAPAVRLRVIPDGHRRWRSMQAGEIDAADLPDDAFAVARARPPQGPAGTGAWHLERLPTPSFEALTLNVARPALAGAARRRALALALDREALAGPAGDFVPIRGPVLPGDGRWLGFEAPAAPDLATARRLLRETGPPAATHPPGTGAGRSADPPLVLRYSTESDPRRAATARAIAAALGAAGVPVTAAGSDERALARDANAGRFDLLLREETLPLHGDPAVRLGSGGGDNPGGYGRPEVDDLFAQAALLPMLAARAPLYARAAALIESDAPVIWLGRRVRSRVRSSSLDGVEPGFYGPEGAERWHKIEHGPPAAPKPH